MSAYSDSLSAAKRAGRAAASGLRDALPPDMRAAGADRIAETGIGFASPLRGAMISAYAAMGSEIDPAALLLRLAREGFDTCLPVVQPLGNPLVFRAWRPGEALVARKWGILEPADTAPTAEPDILLVPLLAFDRQGYRLGYGGGYYDRTLERLRAIKPVVAIGLAFGEQQVDEVPIGPFDQRLDWVLIPDGPKRFAVTPSGCK